MGNPAQDVDLAEHLAALKLNGVRRAKVKCDQHGNVLEFEVELGADVEPVSKFVDKEGKPISLDDGMPELTSDAIAAKYAKPAS